MVDGGAAFEEAVILGLDEVRVSGRIDRDIDTVSRQSAGFTGGTEHDVSTKFAELDATGALVVIGPSISDKALIAAPLADAARLPCINYSGGQRTRSEWMFHYQIGSLEEEP